MTRPALSLAPALYLGTLLTACAPQQTQTLQAGALSIEVSAPASVRAGDLYPVSVTYTNLGTEALHWQDPFHCPYLWSVEDTATGREVQAPEGSGYGCTSDIPPSLRLAPGQRHSGTLQVVVRGLPPGQYRLTPQAWKHINAAYMAGGSGETAQPRLLTPAPQEVRFELR